VFKSTRSSRGRAAEVKDELGSDDEIVGVAPPKTTTKCTSSAKSSVKVRNRGRAASSRQRSVEQPSESDGSVAPVDGTFTVLTSSMRPSGRTARMRRTVKLRSSSVSTRRRPQDPILRHGGVYTLALAYAGTAENSAIEKLLHTTASDASDDVRRAAVTSLALLLFKTLSKCPAWYNYSVKATTHMCVAAPHSRWRYHTQRMMNINKILKIYRTLMQYQSGQHVDIPFSRDSYERQYDAFHGLIIEWCDRQPDKWDALSEELGQAAL
jgi:hypothetical protein